jgi:hypothetical protein
MNARARSSLRGNSYAGIKVAWYVAAMDTHAMSVRLPKDQYERLRRAAFEHRVHMNTLVSEGIELRLAELKAVAKEEES